MGVSLFCGSWSEIRPRESWTDEETDSFSVTESTFFTHTNPYNYFELANGHFFEFGRPVGTKMVTVHQVCGWVEMAFERPARGQRVKTTSFIQVHDFSLLEMYSLHVIVIFYCICEFHLRLLKDWWFKSVFVWICYCVPSFAATVGKCIDYSQITVNYCFVITKYHTQEKKQQIITTKSQLFLIRILFYCKQK